MGDRPDQSSLERRWTEAVSRGDFAEAQGLLHALAGSGDDVRSFELELDAARWLAGRVGARLPSTDEIAERASRGPRRALTRAAGFCVRAAVLRFDRAAVAALAETLRRIARDEASEEAGVHADVARVWESLLHGDHASASAAAADASQRARTTSMGAAVVDLTTAQALIALGQGDTAAATAAARRAVRMAQSEGVPPVELLANIVLARVRRSAGAPHLAMRILGALRDLASPPFAPFIGYELTLSGGPHRSASGDDTAAASLGALAQALHGGAGEAVRGAAASLRERVAGFDDLRAEIDDLLAALGVTDAARASSEMSAWLAGATHQVPRGLHAFAGATTHEASPVVAWVVALPGRPAFRILAPALPFALSAAGATSSKRIDPAKRPQERTDAAIALLAMRAAPIGEEAFFHELYGFAYRPSLHASVMSTLVHRVRATLGDAATLHREEGRLALQPHLPLVAWDPRCQRPLPDRILAVLTQTGPSTAKSAADRLGIPLRTVQAALGELVDGGACKRDRQGRSVEYVVEDTTFAEPTVTRARAWRGEAR